MFAGFVEQFPRWRHPYAFHFIEYLRQQELGGVTASTNPTSWPISTEPLTAKCSGIEARVGSDDPLEVR